MVDRTKHCWQNYVDYHKCIIAKGEDFAPCRQVSLYTSGICTHVSVLTSVISSSLRIVPFAQAPGVNAGTTSEVCRKTSSINASLLKL